MIVLDSRKEFMLKWGTANANIGRHNLRPNNMLPNALLFDHTGNGARKAFLQKLVLV